MNLLHGGSGDKVGSFRTKSGASLGVVIIREVTVNDEGDLDWRYLPFAKILCFSWFTSFAGATTLLRHSFPFLILQSAKASYKQQCKGRCR